MDTDIDLNALEKRRADLQETRVLARTAVAVTLIVMAGLAACTHSCTINEADVWRARAHACKSYAGGAQ